MEENLDPDDEIPTVLTADPESLQASWYGRDFESGILNYMVAIGTTEGGDDITGGFQDYGKATSAQITGINMPVTEDSGNYYYVTVYALNGAGAEGSRVSSNRVKVLNANKAGVVYEGRDLWEDSDAEFDTTSVAISFGGFESELCGIVGYKWGIGNIPGNNDLLAYTDAGIVMLNETHGIAQANLDVPWNKRVYIEVVGITGTNCHEDMILSAGDGFWVDVQIPDVQFQLWGGQEVFVGGLPTDVNYYTSLVDVLQLAWLPTDEESGYNQSSWQFGSSPKFNDLHVGANVTFPAEIPAGEVEAIDKETYFATIYAYDAINNKKTAISAPFTFDSTPPVIKDFDCTIHLSPNKRTLRCTWDYNNDNESPISNVTVSIGSAPEEVRYRQQRVVYYLCITSSMSVT